MKGGRGGRMIGFNVHNIKMNFFSNDIMKGMMNMMSNNDSWGGSGGSSKEATLRSNLERCTYPDETKWIIEKATKQLFHVYPFFNPDILMFTENGQSRRYIELKGILEVDIKGKTCKVDFNMMLPSDYPRSPPFVRIVNRNPDYAVDSFYQSLKSKTDPSSYVLNEKLTSVKGWQPSSSLVNVVIECYDMFKNRFPFSKPVAENPNYSGNAWDTLYNKKGTGGSNFGGGNFNNNPNPNNNAWNPNSNPNSNWGNNNSGGWGTQPTTGWNTNNSSNWGGSNNNTSAWGNNNTWGNPPANNNGWNQPVNNTGWGNQPTSNNWGGSNNNSGWGNAGGMGGMGGMGGIVASNNITANIASAQKLVGKQKGSLQQINGQYLKLIEKVQVLDATKQALQSQENYLRMESFEMSNFLKQSEASASELSSITNIVQPKDALSEQILDLLSGIKAREECVLLLQGKFTQESIGLDEFMKGLRKIEEAKFQEKILLQKCLKRAAA